MGVAHANATRIASRREIAVVMLKPSVQAAWGSVVLMMQEMNASVMTTASMRTTAAMITTIVNNSSEEFKYST